MIDRRYSPDQERDPHGRFSGPGSGASDDAKTKFGKFAKAAAVSVAALALKHYGWKMLPPWAVSLAKKSLRDSADLPEITQERIDAFLAALSHEDLAKLVTHIEQQLSDEQKQHVVDLLEQDSNRGNPMADYESRSFTAGKFKVEKRDGDKPGFKLAGHAAIFNSLSGDLGFRETILPGAFKDAIAKGDARALFNHDPNFVLGRQKNGTLRLAEDERGLSFEIDVPDNQTIRDLVIAPIERGDISEMSFGFRADPADQKWERSPEGFMKRTITRFAEVFDVSPVVYPAYAQTDVALRSMRQAEREIRAAEAPATDFKLLRAKEQQASVQL